MDLTDHIPFGRANAITAKELAARAGYSDVRSLQQDIHNLRVKGALILSATEQPQGYFRPDGDDKHEVRHFLRSMRSRAREIEAAARSAEAYLREQGASD